MRDWKPPCIAIASKHNKAKSEEKANWSQVKSDMNIRRGEKAMTSKYNIAKLEKKAILEPGGHGHEEEKVWDYHFEY